MNRPEKSTLCRMAGLTPTGMSGQVEREAGCHRSTFEQLDAPVLEPMPAERFGISRWKAAESQRRSGVALKTE